MPQFRDDHPWVVLCGLAGLCWVAALFAPWVSRGALSHSSMADVVRLARAGVLDGVLPLGSWWVLLALPVGGIALIAAAPLDGGPARALRAVVAVAGTVVVVLALRWLTHGELDRVGAGAGLAAAGTLGALGGVVHDLALARAGRPRDPSAREDLR